MIIALKLYASAFLDKVIYQAPARPIPGTNGIFSFFLEAQTASHLLCTWWNSTPTIMLHNVAKKTLQVFNKVANQLTLGQGAFSVQPDLIKWANSFLTAVAEVTETQSRRKICSEEGMP